jgi:4-hydroxyproline epimerase
MCGHGTIGLITTLAHLGRIQTGEHRIETPVGIVSTYLHDSGEVTVDNVPAYRTQHQVKITVTDYAPVTGDVAWGGNWFFLVENHGMTLDMQHLDTLTDYTWKIRIALREQGITGDDAQEIDHIELFTDSQVGDSKNFVLCPGKVYDRSPCGTGTSAKMACLYADGKLAVGQVWTQESIIGSVFKGSIKIDNDLILPSITGRAYITAESMLILDQADPFHAGVPQ